MGSLVIRSYDFPSKYRSLLFIPKISFETWCWKFVKVSRILTYCCEIQSSSCITNDKFVSYNTCGYYYGIIEKF